MRPAAAVAIAMAVFTTPATCTTSPSSDPLSTVTIAVILTGLRNPRGVALDEECGLLVAEAGFGDDATDVRER
ncbi:MAG: hypothetical protein ACC658_14255, partial [Acidimicrobiia bacterium]